MNTRKKDNLTKCEVDETICPKCNYSTHVGQTINCDSCRYWFHFNCVGVTEEDDCVATEDAPFYCPSCMPSMGTELGPKLSYTCPKCPKTSRLKEIQKHSKVAHNVKSTLICLECNKNSLYACPAILKKESDDSECDQGSLLLSNLDLASSTYYFCLHCESSKQGKNITIDRQASQNEKETKKITKPIIKKKVPNEDASIKEIPMSKIIKVKGENQVDSYETDVLTLDGSETTGQKIYLGMVPDKNATSTWFEHWQGFNCPVQSCIYITKTLVLLKAHLEDVHKY